MKFRVFLYTQSIFQSYRLTKPVISIGNLTMGGSGKTPLVIYLAQLFASKGLKPAVISRGYKGTAQGKVNVVSDGRTILLSSSQAGDESRLVAELLQDTVVLTGKKRIHPCREAIEKFSSDVLLLDDSFQHLQVQRDIDIVLFNAAELYNNMYVFPGGYLRENFTALSRADCFVITNAHEINRLNREKFKKFLNDNWQNTPLFESSFSPKGYVQLDGKEHDINHLKGDIICFSGIASPERFPNTLHTLGLEVLHHLVFPDHVTYTTEILDKIERCTEQFKTKLVITTEKDMVKLHNFSFSFDLYALSMESRLDKSFDKFILSKISSFKDQ